MNHEQMLIKELKATLAIKEHECSTRIEQIRLYKELIGKLKSAIVILIEDPRFTEEERLAIETMLGHNPEVEDNGS